MKYQWKFAFAIAIVLSFLSAGFYLFEANEKPAQTEVSLSSPENPDAPESPVESAATIKKIAESYGRLPIYFEPNLGQTDERVKFIARGQNYGLFLTDSGAVLSLRKAGKTKRDDRTDLIRMSVENANTSPASNGLSATAGRSNYLIGNEPEKWRTEITNFEKVKFDSVYDGIDMVYYGNGRQLEYDFIVAPNADPNSIRLKFDGVKKVSLEKQSGDLLLETNAGTLRQHKPLVYQNIDGERREVGSLYRLEGARVGFALGEYDRSKELIIDPILAYGSYLGGGTFDEGRGIAVDSQGNAYVVGTAASLNFPTTGGALKTANLPAANNVQWYDAFVTKINPAGTALVYSTYFGGRNGSESGGGIVVDNAGNALISGTTTANDMPVVNAVQTTFGGTDDAFAAKLNATGSALIYSTYIGGNNTDLGGRIALNQTTGEAVFTGTAYSANFPTTPGAYKPQLCTGGASCNGQFFSGGYLVKLSATGSRIYSTLFAASILDVTLDSADNAVFAGGVSSGLATTPGAFQPASSGGGDGYIAKLNPAGGALVFATYLGGGLQSDTVKGIALDSADNIYVTGQTENTGFPVTAGAYDMTHNGLADGFVTKLNAAGSALVYSTFLGGAGKDQPSAIGLGQDNEVFVTGETTSNASFPLRNSLNQTGSIFLTRLNSNATSLVFSSFLGVGGAYDMVVDGGSNTFLTGHTTSILTTPNAFQTVLNNDPSNISSKDGFVVKIAPTDENGAFYSIGGTVTDQNSGYTNDYSQISVTVTGTVSRSMLIPYSGGPFNFSNLPAGGNYTVTVKKAGYLTSPESATFNNLGANQSADFAILRNHQPMGTITAPAHGATFNAPGTINIQATAADEDGDAIQKVDFVAYSSATGSIPLGTDTAAPYEFTWTNVPVGTWSLYAIPTDSKGLRGDSQPVVHVQVVDPAPLSVSILSPAENQSFTEGDNVPIQVQVSSSVTQVQIRDQNDTLLTRMSGGTWSTTWRVMDPGSYTLTATAQNSQGQTAASAPVHITVGTINHRITGKVIDNFTNAPIPNVTVRFACSTNTSINAAAMTDENGDYLFTNLGTTPNDAGVITPELPGYNFEPPSRTIHYLGYINWEHQTFLAHRNNAISVALASPTQGQQFNAPATIEMRANAATGDSTTISKVEFYRGQYNNAQLIGTDTAAPYEFEWTDVPAGNYQVYARATDSNGAMKDSEVATISVNAAAATVRLSGDVSSPGGGFMPGVTLNLTGTANGNPINQTAVSNFFGAYGFYNLPAGGNYTITPQAAGSQSYTPSSASFMNVVADNINVNFQASASNQPPAVQINSPVDGAIYTMPASIPVNASATDADGSIVRLTLTAVSATRSFTIGQQLGGNFSALWQPSEPGEYTIWASAVDNGGLNASASLHITVNPPAPVSISGRAVDRNSIGIEGVTVELREFGDDEPLVTAVTTAADGSYAIPDIATFKNYILKVEKEDHSFSPQRRNYFNLSQTLTGIDFTGTLQVPNSDFDGDGESDLAVWRPSNGIWHVSRSNNGVYTAQQFGQGSQGDIVTPGNFDGDKKIDYAFYREGVWNILNSSDGRVRTIQFGMAGDQPVPGDYDGDGKTDAAVWRPSSGVWYIQRSSDGQYDVRQFGVSGDKALTGDYDGDGMSDVTIWRPSNGAWYIWLSSGGYHITQFGVNGDIPTVGDFDGDKKADITIYRPSNGAWYVIESGAGNYLIMPWGVATDKPVPGDYDRDGKTDFAVFRETAGDWYIYLSSRDSFVVRHFGMQGDIPIPAAYAR